MTNDFSTTTLNSSNEFYSWGDPKMQVETRRLKNSLTIISWLLLAALFLFIAALPILDWLDGYPPSQLIISLIFGGFIGVPALYMAWRTWQQRNNWAATYSEGFRASLGGKQVALRWEDVADIRQNLQTIRVNLIPIKIRYFSLRDKDGKKYTLGNGLKDIELIGKIMQQQMTAQLLPEIIKRYENGEKLNFSGISIDQLGLYHKKKSLPWQEFEKIDLQGGMITFHKQGKRLRWSTLNINLTKNIYVFIGLLGYLGKL